MDQRLDLRVMEAFHNRHAEPPFTTEQLQPFKQFVDEFLMAQGIEPNSSVPADQQLCLYILQSLCSCMQDPDEALFPSLLDGVPLGMHEEILPSKCFPSNQPDALFDPPLLSVHHTNWQSAEDEPSIVQELIDKEIAEGWVVQFDSTIEDAQSFFPNGLAVGKLGLALSESRPPDWGKIPRFVVSKSLHGMSCMRIHCVIPKRRCPGFHSMLRVLISRYRCIQLAGAFCFFSSKDIYTITKYVPLVL